MILLSTAIIAFLSHAGFSKTVSPGALVRENLNQMETSAKSIWSTSLKYLGRDDSTTRSDAYTNLLNAELAMCFIKESKVHQQNTHMTGPTRKAYVLSHIKSMGEDIKERLTVAKKKLRYTITQAKKGMDPAKEKQLDKAIEENRKAYGAWERNPNKATQAALDKSNIAYWEAEYDFQDEINKLRVPITEAGISVHVAARQWEKAINLLNDLKKRVKDKRSQEEKIKVLKKISKELRVTVTSNKSRSIQKRFSTIARTLSNVVDLLSKGLY